MIFPFCDLFTQPMKTLKPTTPTSIVQKVTGPLPLTQMEIPPQIPVPQPLPTAARQLSLASTAYQ